MSRLHWMIPLGKTEEGNRICKPSPGSNGFSMTFLLILSLTNLSCNPIAKTKTFPSEGHFFLGPDVVEERVVSPDKKHIAILLYGRSSGPEGGRNFVALVKADERLRFNKAHEVIDEQIIYDAVMEGVIGLHWKDKTHLSIDTYCRRGDTEKKRIIKDKKDNVIFSYTSCPF